MNEQMRKERLAKLRQLLANPWKRGLLWLLVISSAYSLYHCMMTGKIYFRYSSGLHSYSESPSQYIESVTASALGLLMFGGVLLWFTFSKDPGRKR
jgi:hypothetical protein